MWEKVKMKVTQLYLTLCNLMDYTVHGILQARILEWVAVPFSRESSQPKDQTQVFCTVGGFFTVCATREATFSNISYDSNKSDVLNVICFITISLLTYSDLGQRNRD